MPNLTTTNVKRRADLSSATPALANEMPIWQGDSTLKRATLEDLIPVVGGSLSASAFGSPSSGTAINAALAYASANGYGQVVVPGGEWADNIEFEHPNVSLVGVGRGTCIKPASGSALAISGVTAGAGSMIGNMRLSGTAGAATGLSVAGFSRGHFAPLWIDAIPDAIDINGDSSTEFDFDYVYVAGATGTGVKYRRTNTVDTGGLYFRTLHVAGSGGAIGLDFESDEAGRSRAFLFIDRLVIDGRSDYAVRLKNIAGVYIDQSWLTGTVSGKPLLYINNVKDLVWTFLNVQNSHATGYNIEFDGVDNDQIADLQFGIVRSSGAGSFVQFSNDPVFTRCTLGASVNNTCLTISNDDDLMAELRAIPGLSASGVTQVENMSVTGFLSLPTAEQTKTIASGVITATGSFHRIGGEGGVADDLVTINGGSDTDMLIVMALNSGVAITVKHGTGNIRLAGGMDRVLADSRDKLMLINLNSEWVELSYSPVSSDASYGTLAAATLNVSGFINTPTTVQTKTIASGVITATGSFHRIGGEGGVADDLVTINGGSDTSLLILMALSGAVTITVKHGTGNIRLAGGADVTLAGNRDRLILQRLNSEWVEVSYADNA